MVIVLHSTGGETFKWFSIREDVICIVLKAFKMKINLLKKQNKNQENQKAKNTRWANILFDGTDGPISHLIFVF